MSTEVLVLPEVRITSGAGPLVAPAEQVPGRPRVSNRAAGLLRAQQAPAAEEFGGFGPERTAQDDADVTRAGAPPPERARLDTGTAASHELSARGAPTPEDFGGFGPERTAQDDADVERASAPPPARGRLETESTASGRGLAHGRAAAAATTAGDTAAEAPAAEEFGGFGPERTAQDDADVARAGAPPAARAVAATEPAAVPGGASPGGPDPSGIRTPEQLVEGVRTAAAALSSPDLRQEPLRASVAPSVAAARARAHRSGAGGGGGAPRARPVEPISIDPVPKATEAVAAALRATLPALALPALAAAPTGIPAPVLHPSRLPALDAGELRTSAPEPPATTGKTVTDAEKKRRASALAKAKAPPAVEEKPPVPLDPPVLLDVRRPAPPPVPAFAADFQKAQVARVLGIIAESLDERAKGTVQAVRDAAFPDSTMGTTFTAVTDPWRGEVSRSHRAALDKLAAAAGMVAGDLDAAARARAQELKDKVEHQASAAELDAQAAADALTDAERTKRARIEAEQRRTEARRVQRLRLALHSHDPALVDELVTARLGYLAADVGAGVVAIDAAAKRREELLTAYEAAYVDAYRRADNTAQTATQAGADGAAVPATAPAADWATTAAEGTRAAFTELRTGTGTAAAALVTALTTAAESARGAVRDWREQRLRRVKHTEHEQLRATTDREAVTAQIDKARADAALAATRQQLVGEIGFVAEAYRQKQQRLHNETIDAGRKLSDERMAIAEKYLAAGKPGDPLSAVAEVLAGRQREKEVAARAPTLRELILTRVPQDEPEARDLGSIYFPGKGAGLINRARKLRAAFEVWHGTAEEDAINQLTGVSGHPMALLNATYELLYKENLQWRIKDEMSGSDLDMAVGLAGDDGSSTAAAARQRHARGVIADSDGIFSNDPQRALEAIRALPPGEADAVAKDPSTAKHLQIVLAGDRFDYGKRAWVSDTRGQDQLEVMLQINRIVHTPGEPRPPELRWAQARADAIEMDRYVRRGTAGDPPDLSKLFARIRADVIADPESQGWSAHEVDQEIRRRTRDMEHAYQQQFGAEMPEAANAMREAMARYLWGTNKQLATDLLDVNRAGVRATRLQKTTEGAYTSDSEMNTELGATYAEALAEVQRSRALRQEVAAETTRLLGEHGFKDRKPDANTLAAYRREATENVANRLATQWFAEVDTTFGKRYAHLWGGNPKTALREMVTDTTQFGGEREALDRISGHTDSQGRWRGPTGGLSAAQSVEHGLAGWGMEKDPVMGGIGGRTQEQLDRIGKEFKDNTGKNMVAELQDETGGWSYDDPDTSLERDAFDVKEALRGVATTPEQEMAAVDRRTTYEESVYFANNPAEREMAVGTELADLRTARARAAAAYEAYKSARNSGDALAIGNAEAGMRVAREELDSSADFYREAVDAYVDRAAQIAAIAAAVLVTIVTWGAAGPLVIALAASVAGTAAAMATKADILGSAYSRHAITNDVIVGVVDAIVTVLTARLGNVLLRLPKPTGTGKVLQASLKAIEAQRLAKPLLARVGAFAAEQVAQAAPSAVTGALLDRSTWKGDPVKNVATAAGLASAVGIGVGGVMHGVSNHGPKIFGAALDRLQLLRRGTLAEISAERVLLRSTADALASGQPVGDSLAHRGTPRERLAAQREYLRRFPERTPADFQAALRDGTAEAVGSADAQRALRREMLAELLDGIPPAERSRFVDTPILVLSDAEFLAATGSEAKGRAATLVLHGEPVVVIRERAPLSALREEGMHARQLRDAIHADRVALLDEQNLTRWKSASLEQRTAAWQAKIDLELEVQARTVADLDERLSRGGLSTEQRAALRSQLDDAHAAIDILGQRRVTLDALDDAAMARIRSGAVEPPPFLADEPRLFNKAAGPPPEEWVPVPGQPGVLVAVPVVKKVIDAEYLAPDGRRMRWVHEWDPAIADFRRIEQVYNPKSKRWNLHGDSPRWSGMVGETAMKLEHARLVGVGPDGVRRVQLDAQTTMGTAFDDVMPEFRTRPDGSVDATLVVYESKYYRNRVGSFTAIDDNFTANLQVLRQRLEGIRDSGSWEAAGMSRIELDAALRAVDGGQIRVVVRTAESTKMSATALAEIQGRLRTVHGGRVSVERGPHIPASSLAEAEGLWLQMERYRLGGHVGMSDAEAAMVLRLASRANGITAASIDAAEAVLMARRLSGFLGADVAWDPTGAFLVSGGDPVRVLTPRRPPSGRFDPAAAAREILGAAGSSVRPTGAAAALPVKVVVDVGLLDAGEVRALQEAMRRQSRARSSAAVLARTRMVMVPEGIPAEVKR